MTTPHQPPTQPSTQPPTQPPPSRDPIRPPSGPDRIKPPPGPKRTISDAGTHIAFRRLRKTGGGSIRQYSVDSVVCKRLPAREKSAFVVAGKAVQGRKLHRPNQAESLWADGRPVGLTVKTVCHVWLVNYLTFDADPDTFDYCDACLIEAWPGPCVYRLFDHTGGLLYVGCSINLLSRIQSHLTAPWGSLIASHTFEVFPDHLAALVAEKIAILNERPQFNRDLTDRARIAGRRPEAFGHLVST